MLSTHMLYSGQITVFKLQTKEKRSLVAKIQRRRSYSKLYYFLFIHGLTNLSWSLRAKDTSRHVCRGGTAFHALEKKKLRCQTGDKRTKKLGRGSEKEGERVGKKRKNARDANVRDFSTDAVFPTKPSIFQTLPIYSYSIPGSLLP